AMVPDSDHLKRFLKTLSAQASDSGPVFPLTPELPLPSGKPRLSVCLITRDEEAFLARCLNSIRSVADQIVVVDTGSQDRTIQIAQQFGAEVYHFPWCDDFAAARNTALEHATGDWVLILDADEELIPQAKPALLAELGDSRAIAYRLPLIDA